MSCPQLIPKPFLVRTSPKLRTAAFRLKSLSLGVRLKPPLHYFFSTVSCSLNSRSENSDDKTAAFIHTSQNADVLTESQSQNESLNFILRSPNFQANLFPAPKLSLSDKAFFLLAFIACTTSVAFTSLVVAAVPTLYAMGRAAISLSKLADTAREELPSTMAAIRLSGMEISDLSLELSDLSQEIADGVSKSAQAVQVAEAGIRQIGSLARQQTTSMIQERANLPTVSLKPVVARAAKKTSRALGQATKRLMNMISGGELKSADKDGNSTDS